jgi:hypothetical protein
MQILTYVIVIFVPILFVHRLYINNFDNKLKIKETVIFDMNSISQIALSEIFVSIFAFHLEIFM